MAKVTWHRLETSRDGFIRGYISHDGDWAVGRSGRQASVWQYVPRSALNECLSGLYDPANPSALVDFIGDRAFVHRWDSVNIRDAKFEVQMEMEGK